MSRTLSHKTPIYETKLGGKGLLVSLRTHIPKYLVVNPVAQRLLQFHLMNHHAKGVFHYVVAPKLQDYLYPNVSILSSALAVEHSLDSNL
jgi:hypothetical protein